ncbi:hypothetical protein [Streptomyces sp. NBC_00457]|uniref:hypothetical protein n=1 Tax=Streptomyces sp. NBC_00457 TaxID=2975748 RepID=UPI003FCE8FDB
MVLAWPEETLRVVSVLFGIYLLVIMSFSWLPPSARTSPDIFGRCISSRVRSLSCSG